MLQARFRNAIDIRGIGHPINAEAECVDGAVMNLEGHGGNGSARTLDGDGPTRLHGVQVDDRRVIAAGCRVEAVGEAGAQHTARRVVGPDLHPLALQQEERPQVVDAMGMVRVLVGIEHGIDIGRSGAQHLLTKIRRSVYQNARFTCRA